MSGSSNSLSWRQRLGYAVGDLYGGGSGVLISLYYLVFLVDVVHIRPGLAGLVILLSKVYDSVTDPFEGILTDRTRTRLGRRRPYLMAGIVLIPVSLIALFYAPSQPDEGLRTLIVIGEYLLFSTVVSLVTLNYNALQSELTPDYDERTQLSSMRIVVSAVSALLAALLPLRILGLFQDIRQGWLAVGAFFGLLYALPMTVTVLTAVERPEFQRKPEEFRWPGALIEPFRLRTFRSLLAIYLLAFVALDCLGSILVFFVRDYMGLAGDVGFVSGLVLASQVFAMPVYLWLMRRYGKAQGYIAGACVWAAGMLCSFLLAPGQPAWVLYAFAALIGLGVGGVSLSVYAMFPDIPDVDELKSGERREGMYSSFFTLVRKFSSALAVFTVAQVLGLAGYAPPVQVVSGGLTRLEPVAQSQSFLLTLRLLFGLLPAVMLLMGGFLARRYPLTRALHTKLGNVLDARRRGETPPEGQDSLAGALIGPD